MLNKAQIIGRVGKDPEIRYSAAGDAIANFSVATSERYKDKSTGNAVEKTEWHNVSAFRRLAEIIGEYVKKGSLVYIEGKIQTRKWQDKDGQDRYTTGIVASEMKILTPRGESEPAQQPQPKPAASNQGSLADLDDDIPF